jgi:MSHA pilin protein MshD
MYNNRHSQSGATIIELVIFIVIVGIAAATILQVMNLANRASTDPIRRKQAMLIAEAYMEEIQQAQFTVCDPTDANAATATTTADCADSNLVERFGHASGAVRPFYHINDYVQADYVFGQAVRAFAEPDANGALVDRDVAGAPLGAALGNVPMSAITTTLTLRSGLGLGGIASPVNANNPADIDALRITITVNYGANESVVLDGYRTRYEPRAR